MSLDAILGVIFKGYTAIRSIKTCLYFVFQICVLQMSKSQASFNNVLLLKDSSTELITIRDKMVNVLCKINVLLDAHVKYSFDVAGNGTEYHVGLVVAQLFTIRIWSLPFYSPFREEKPRPHTAYHLT